MLALQGQQERRSASGVCKQEGAERAGTEARAAARAGPHAALIPALSASGLDRAALALANLHNDVNIFTSAFALQGICLKSKND